MSSKNFRGSLAELFDKSKQDKSDKKRQNKNTSCPSQRKQFVRHNFSIFDSLYQNSSGFNRSNNNNKPKQQNKNILTNITNSFRNKAATSRKRSKVSDARQNIDNKRRKVKQKRKYNRIDADTTDDEILSDCASLISSPGNSSPYTVNSVIKKMKQAKLWAEDKINELYDINMSSDEELDTEIAQQEVKIDEESTQDSDNDVVVEMEKENCIPKELLANTTQIEPMQTLPPRKAVIFEIANDLLSQTVLSEMLKIDKQTKAKKAKQALQKMDLDEYDGSNTLLLEHIRGEFHEFLNICQVSVDHAKANWNKYHFCGVPVFWLLDMDEESETESDNTEINEEQSETEDENMNETGSGFDSDPDYRPSQYYQKKMLEEKLKEKQHAFYIPGGDINSKTMTRAEDTVGRRSKICPYCTAKLFEEERDGLCCDKGKTNMKEYMLPKLPETLYKLYYGTDSRSKNFRKHILAFNNAFTMTSSGITRVQPPGRGPPVYKIQGVPHHKIGSLRAPTTRNYTAQYIQLYLIDTTQALTRRAGGTEYLKSTEGKATLRQIQNCLNETNQLVKEYKMAIERQDNQQHKELALIFKEDTPKNKQKQGHHPGIWNLPTGQGVCGLIVDMDETDVTNSYRDIVLHCKENNTIKQIYETHELYDILHYIMLFPRGQSKGWNIYRKNKKGKRLSSLKWYRFRCIERCNEQDYLFRSGLLWQKYLIDMWSKILLQQLRFCQLNQNKIRAAAYQDVDDHMQNEGQEQLGKRIILPPTVPGSDRHMKELFHDFMAIVRKYGNPDLFITVTCNPQWTDILQELKGSQLPSDVPGLCNRVFKIKLLHILNDLKKNGVLGRVIANVYVIEFQKRGLPHAHILVFLHPDDKPKTPEQVDKIISAEVPDPVNNKELFELVKKHMLHTPCDPRQETYDPKAVHHCRKRMCDKCRGRFPFKFQKVSELPETKFAVTKRTSKQDGGHVIIWKQIGKDGKTVEIDSRWIVHYNADFLLKYKCSINIEISGSQDTVKYMCSYFTKGYDRSSFTVTSNDRDEIESFKNGRYVGPFAAHWNIFGFGLSFNDPSVKRLALHLEGEQSILHEDITELQQNRVEFLKRTELTAFFEVNSKEIEQKYNPPSRNILYQDFPEYYIWVPKTRAWKRRDKKYQIGRIRAANFREGERWCLRKLLLRISGAASYEELKRVPKTEDVNILFPEDDWDTQEAEFEEDEEKAITVEESTNNIDNNTNIMSGNHNINHMDVDIDEKEEKAEDNWEGEDPNNNIMELDDEMEDDSYFDFEEPEQHILDRNMRPDEYTQYATFRAACAARGYLDSDKEWHLTLKEAEQTATPSALRDLFALILLNNEPTDTRKLWNKHKRRLCDDFIHRAEESFDETKAENIGYNQGLLVIRDILEISGRNMKDFDLPQPIEDERFDRSLPLELLAEVNYDIGECTRKWKTAYQLMKQHNKEQQAIFEEIATLIDDKNPSGKYFFIDGPGGTGKTHLFNALLNYVRSQPITNNKNQRHIAVACAASGIAGLLLEGGRTVHNRFGLGINVNETTTCRYNKGTKCAKTEILKRAEIIIWDEATMSSKYMLKAVDVCLRDIMEKDVPFGGKLVIFGGDFRQTSCIVEGGNKAMEINQNIKSSPLWSNIYVRKLKTNMRVKLNQNENNKARLQNWSQFLLDVGNKKITAIQEAIEKYNSDEIIRVPDEIISNSNTVQQLISEIYPNLAGEIDEEHLEKTAILAPRNKDVDKINDMALSRVSGVEKILYSQDSVVDDGNNISRRYQEEYLNGINLSGFPVHKLKLKVGAPIMLLRNLSPLKGLCNGTRLVLKRIGKYNLTAKIVTGPCKGNIVLIPRIGLETQKRKLGFQLKRKQFPVRLAYCMTINKSQGQSLRNVGLYLPRPCFGHGQLYVALSRVGDPNWIKVMVVGTKEQGIFDGFTYTKNVVYTELLND